MDEPAAKLQIGVASAADLEALAALVEAFRDHLVEAEPRSETILPSLRRLLAAPDADLLLARDAGGRPLGYAQLRARYSLWAEGFECELEDLWVEPAARGRGVGSALVAAAIARTRTRGARVLQVATNERNADALRLYRRAGFAAERARWGGGRQLLLKRTLEDA